MLLRCDVMSNQAKTVVVGISGGVDSAVAALLLKQQGYDVRGVFMKNWSEDDFGGPCPWLEDQAAATAVANHLGIPLETWNFEREYRDRVFQAMLDEYKAGRTPNPDILCNREIKFKLFFDKAREKADLIATGHYARTTNGKLLKAVDTSKDQSYFLAGITSAALKDTLFPLGEIRKSDVREIAKNEGLPNWDRPDSVGICFIGEKQMGAWLGKHLKLLPGPITLLDGTVVGTHRGFPLYTIGQRHGFGHDIDQALITKKLGSVQSLFVQGKNATTNTIVVAPATNIEDLQTKEFLIREMHWISYACSFPWTGNAKFRYRQDDVPVTLLPEGDKFRVICLTPQRAITPGQYAVFYDGDVCLGCGVIE